MSNEELLTLKMTVESSPLPADLEKLDALLDSSNVSSLGSRAEKEPLAVFLRTPRNEIAAGLFGVTRWQWFFIKHLWVYDRLRGKGAGRALMEAGETEAIRRGCTRASVDTFSFQAPGFYEKLGYKIFGVLENCPPGHSRYYMQKELLNQ